MKKLLTAQPKCEEETQHQVRMVCGVGMRPKIWTEFVERFKVRPRLLTTIELVWRRVFMSFWMLLWKTLNVFI